jgi:energy-coupling factor transporter ATP-binding protein EcfA2
LVKAWTIVRLRISQNEVTIRRVKNRQEVLGLMMELKQQQKSALILVTHDLGIAKKMDRFLTLENGTLIWVEVEINIFPIISFKNKGSIVIFIGIDGNFCYQNRDLTHREFIAVVNID